MRSNVGPTDRAVRAILGVLLVITALVISPATWVSVTLYVLAALLVLTALFGWCPLYALFHLDTTGHQRSRHI